MNLKANCPRNAKNAIKILVGQAEKKNSQILFDQ